MLTIKVSVAEKRCTTSQYENIAVGADLEATNIECLSPEDVQRRTHELFQLARGAVQRQLLEMVPAGPGPTAAGPSLGTNGHTNGHAKGAANGHVNGNGHAEPRRFGRPLPEVTPRQRILVEKIARERNLSPKDVGEVAEKVCGAPLARLDRNQMSALIEALLDEVRR